MTSRFGEPRVFKLQQIFDDVLTERLAGMQLAVSQILDLLGNVLDIETVCAGPAAAQQFRLFLRPGIEILVVERMGDVIHVGTLPETAVRRCECAERDRSSRSCRSGEIFAPRLLTA